MKSCLIVTLFLIFSTITAFAGEADVVKVEIEKAGDGTYRFNVRVFHQDEGWQHYVDKWEILDPDGSVLATRVLYHPHVNEQPFTRSLSGVKVPAGLTSLSVRAHDSVHEYGGKMIEIDLFSR